MPLALTLHDIRVVRALNVLCGALGTIGAVLLIVCFVMFKELRTYSSRLIVFLSIADLGDSIGWMMSPGAPDHTTCVIQGMFIQGFSLSAILWQVAIAAYILQVNLGVKNLEKQEIWYHVICWGAPGLTVLVGGIYQIYGIAGPWCWIIQKYAIVGIGILYIPFVVAITFTSILYTIVGVILKRKAKESLSEREKVKLHHMQQRLRSRFYLIPFALGWVFGIINRVHNLASPDRIMTIYALQGVFFPLQGFWNFLMYGLTERIRGPQAINDILSNPKCRKHFSVYLEVQRASENIDLWNDLAKLKTIPTGTPEWDLAAQQIVTDYIVQGAPKEVNITGSVKEELGAILSVSGFEKAEKEILDLMQQNMIYFRASPQHLEMIEELQTSEAVSGSLEGRRLLSAFVHRVFISIHSNGVYRRMSCAAEEPGIKLDKI